MYCGNLQTIRISDNGTSLGNSVFEGCIKLKKVDMGNGITNIGGSTFHTCSSLKSVTLPNSLQTISGAYHFYRNGVRDIVIPDSVTSDIGGATFQGVNAKSITIGNGVKNIHSTAFEASSTLTTVTIGSGVTNIQQNAFSGVSNLSRIIFIGKSSEEVKALPNYPWGLTNCKFICGKDVDEESGANGKYPLFVIDLNPGTERIWTGLELKATTNNFNGVGIGSVPFYSATMANGTSLGDYVYDWCRLYILSKRADTDIRKWIRITNTYDLNGYAPTSLAILVDPTLFKRGQDANWMKESNPELIWSYTKIGLNSREVD